MGEIRFVREGLNLFKAGLEQGFLLENEQISHNSFTNIVALALKIQDFDWVKNFMAIYHKNLPRQFRQTTLDFNEGRLHFEQKNYEKAMPILARFESSDYLMTLATRTMLLKMDL